MKKIAVLQKASYPNRSYGGGGGKGLRASPTSIPSIVIIEGVKMTSSIPESQSHADYINSVFCGTFEKVEGRPQLSRFLPRRPVIPAPPGGWVYVGIGREENGRCKLSEDIIGFDGDNGWGKRKGGYLGSSSNYHYAICRSAPAEVWHRFGLYSPYEA